MRTILTAATALAVAACAPDFDDNRTADTRSFGERVMTLMCKRIAFQLEPSDVSGEHYREACNGGPAPSAAPPALAALFAHRDALVQAIDTAVPADMTDELQAFLVSDAVLALYDDDTMARAVANVGDLLSEIATDDDSVGALARAGVRDGYRPPEAAFGMAAALVRARSLTGRSPDGGAASGATVVPTLRDVLLRTVPALTGGGAAHAEWDALIAAVSATLRDASAPADAAAADRTATLAAKLLLDERADLGESTMLPLVRRDPRGIARIATVGGGLPSPFVDLDLDGLADVDAIGRFVDRGGAPLAIDAPFTVAGDTAARDDAGRVDAFAYVALDRTVIGALGHDAAALFERGAGTATGIAFDLVRGASALLGPRVAVTHAFDSGATLDYTGYDLARSPLLDLVYGWLQLLRDANLGDTLALVDALLADHPAVTARLVEAAVRTARLGDAHPEAQIAASAPLWDDLMPVVRQIVGKPALVAALLTALERPETQQLAQRFSDLMRYRDRFDIDPATQAVTGAFATPVDRGQPDAGFLRSVFERFVHLLADSNHAQLCNKADAHVAIGSISYPLIGGYQPCGLIQIDNLATFFVRAIAYRKSNGAVVCENAAGNDVSCSASGARPSPAAEMTFKDAAVNTAVNALGGDAFLESQVGIAGFRRHPTPQALTRVLFLVPMPAFLTPSLDPVRDRDGEVYAVAHAGTLPVLEKNNFYDQFRPIAQAFVDNGAEQQLVDLLTVLHRHWPSAASPDTQHTNPVGANYASGAGGVSWEPLIIDALAGDLLPALVQSAPELDAIRVNDKPYAQVVASAAAFVVDPLAGLADRQGRTTSVTADGKVVAQLSPWQLLADAYVAKQARVAATAGEGAAWGAAVRGLVDVLFRAELRDGAWTFRNPRVRAVSRAVVQHVRERVAAHADRAAWVGRALPDDARDLLTHPIVAGLADLTARLTAEGAPRDALETLLHDAFDETASPALFAMLRTASADLIQLLADDRDVVPLARLAGRLLARDQPYLSTQLDLLQRLAAADENAVLVRLAGQLFAGYAAADPGVSSVAAIADGVGEIDRVAPSAQRRVAWTQPDYAAVLGTVADFLREQQRGLPRFIAIVKGRKP